MALDQSLTSHVLHHALGAEIVYCTMLGAQPVFVLADGRVQFCNSDGTLGHTIALNPEAGILCASANATHIFLGTDDGRVLALDAAHTLTTLYTTNGANDTTWIDALTCKTNGTIAFSASKTVFTRDNSGKLTQTAMPSTVRGLAFLPKGFRLACAHYNGISLWYPSIDAAIETLAWKGVHLGLTLSPDGRFAITAMQEPELHGWRLMDKKNMRMAGYTGKVRSFSWSHDGKWMATSGAEAAIIWPFAEKGGPMGKSPRECGVRPVRVAQVAFHPKSLVVAIGYEDGFVMLCRLTDGAELLVHHQTDTQIRDSITTLGWSADGKQLLFGSRSGEAGVLTLPI